MNYAQSIWIVIKEMLSAALGLIVADFKQTLHVHG